MAGKVSGVTHPADLADGATVTETWVDNVTNSIVGLDGALGKDEVVHVVTADAETSNDNTETTLWTYTVPANTMGTANMYHFEYAGYTYNGVGTTYTTTYKLYYGSTSISFAHEMVNSSSNLPVYMQGSVQGNAATGAQILYAHFHTRQAGATPPSYGLIDTAVAEDSTGALDFKLTATLSSANANLRFGILWAKLYYVDVT